MKSFDKIGDAFDYMKEVYNFNHMLRTKEYQLTPEEYLYSIVDSNLLSMI